MAKKRKNQKRKHNQNNNQSDFLADVPESSNETEWSPEMDTESSSQNNIDTQVQLEEAHETENYVEESHHSEMDSPVETHEQNMIEEKAEPETHNGVILGHTIGPFLKKERENLGIQLKNVVQSTKISLTNLENLESDNLDSLPDKAYVTGYVKSYAKLLGLNIEQSLKLLDYTYEKLGKVQGPQEIVIPQAQTATHVAAPVPTAKIAVIAGAVIILAAIVGSMIWFFSGTDAGKSEEKATGEVVKQSQEITPQSLSAETPLQAEALEGTPVAETTNEPEAKEEAPQVVAKESKESKVEKVQDEPKPEPVKVEKKEEIKEVAAKKEEEKKEDKKEDKKEEFFKMSSNLYSVDEDMSEEKINELLPARFRVAPSDDIHAVFITASKGDSWLTYKSDDDDVRKFVLKEGRSVLIRGRLTRLFLGNLGAVNIFLNNQPLKVRSPSGVKSLVFPQSESENYVTPLFIYKKDGTVITSEQYLEENPQ